MSVRVEGTASCAIVLILEEYDEDHSITYFCLERGFANAKYIYDEAAAVIVESGTATFWVNAASILEVV